MWYAFRRRQVEHDAFGGDFGHINPLLDPIRVIPDQLGGMKGRGQRDRKPTARPEPLHLRFFAARGRSDRAVAAAAIGNEIVDVTNLPDDRSICANLHQDEITRPVFRHD